MAFSSPDDLMKNLLKAMANISRMMGSSRINMIDPSTFRMSIKEYKDMEIKVGDKVTIEITKQVIAEFRYKL